ncbi:helix-turn-helix domain-containing protein [Streptomyces sp. NPDC051322]|uniref:TetR/AcrR family transcriptional regulator n=1 Tax=Streptomyces sp. NPDC051322 TaxID=3154645 RepID=UPI00344D693A
MHIQDAHWQNAATADGNGRAGAGTITHSAPLRVDAQRNLEHVLRAAREVFGELGYGAPMEDVARRARVGVGTVYRRFPSKEVLVRRIAEEETSRLTDQARTALGQEDEPWSALSCFLRSSVASGAGRLLPPQVLRVSVPGPEDGVAVLPVRDGTRVPQQRSGSSDHGPSDDGPSDDGAGRDTDRGSSAGGSRWAGAGLPELSGLSEDDAPGAAELIEVVGQLVDRARGAGALRAGVTVGDVLLVIATAAPALPEATQQVAASSRLLDILLEGLRSRTA